LKVLRNALEGMNADLCGKFQLANASCRYLEIAKRLVVE
jgi:hypothetical protein